MSGKHLRAAHPEKAQGTRGRDEVAVASTAGTVPPHCRYRHTRRKAVLMSWDLRFRIAIFVSVSFLCPVFAMVIIDRFTSDAANPLLSTILLATVSALLVMVSDAASLQRIKMAQHLLGCGQPSAIAGHRAGSNSPKRTGIKLKAMPVEFSSAA
jgi:hypothetical protein